MDGDRHQEHLALLGGQAKGLLLGMLLVPEAAPVTDSGWIRTGALLSINIDRRSSRTLLSGSMLQGCRPW